MKTILPFLLLLLSHPSPGGAATNLPQVLEKPAAELFRAGETQIDLNAFTRTDSRLDNFDNGGGFGVNHFFTRNLGVGVDFQAEDTASAFFDRIGAAGIWRYPIKDSHFAPEVKLGYSYDFERGDNDHSADKYQKKKPEDQPKTTFSNDGNGHEVFAGAGGEWRFTKAFGLGAEVRCVKPLDGRNQYWIGIVRGRFNF